MHDAQRIEKSYIDLFGERPLLVRSPGRVNLLGEHTDYNEGFVLPAAISKSMVFAIGPSRNGDCRIVAADMNDDHQFQLPVVTPSPKGWPNYILGVVDELQKAGHALRGFRCVYGGDIPIGAGMSSSAAIEGGIAFGLNVLFELGIDNLSLVKLAQRAENRFVGVQCGIMDQYVNIFGQQGKVLRIDCRSLEYEAYPFEYDNIAIVLFDSRVSHSLASSEYNRRRAECREGVEVMRKRFPAVKSLRDVSLKMLEECTSVLDPTVYRRCRYVVDENNRMVEACGALARRDISSFGVLMYLTHAGLRDDYAVSCKELDFLVDATENIPEVYGARMMGGGFGGCTINLVENDAVERFTGEIAEKYARRFDIRPHVYVTSIRSGTAVLTVGEDARV